VSPSTLFVPGTLVNTTGAYVDLGSWLVRGEAQAAPEPTTLALFGLGLAGLGFSRRKQLPIPRQHRLRSRGLPARQKLPAPTSREQCRRSLQVLPERSGKLSTIQ
jgi:hypothetical protein